MFFSDQIPQDTPNTFRVSGLFFFFAELKSVTIKILRYEHTHLWNILLQINVVYEFKFTKLILSEYVWSFLQGCVKAIQTGASMIKRVCVCVCVCLRLCV